MDKYQEFLINLNNSYYGFATNGQLSKDTILIDNKIVLTQNEDITIHDYMLYIANESISSIYAIKGETQIELSNELDPIYSSKGGNQNRFFVPVSFEDKFESLKIVFKNNLADDLTLAVSYVLADKEKYYAKKEQEYKDNLLKTADIKVSTGADLVNIYFQPCCDKYEYTEIQLYIPKEFVTVGGPYGPVQKPSTWSMIKKSKVDPEEFYKSINGLANGKYSFILKQYDKDNAIILETGHIEFTISTPKAHGIRPHINRI